MWHAWVKEATESWKHFLLISRRLSGWKYLPGMVPTQLQNVNYCHWSSSLHTELIRIVNMSSLQLETHEILLSYAYSMSLGGLEDQIYPSFKEMFNLTLDAKGRRVIWNLDKAASSLTCLTVMSEQGLAAPAPSCCSFLEIEGKLFFFLC